MRTFKELIAEDEDIGSQYKLVPLPYAYDALEPAISKETLEYHHNKHLKTYVKKLNKQIKDNELNGRPLEEVVKRSSGTLFNDAAQVWNHNFYFANMGKSELQGEMSNLLKSNFGSLREFREVFKKHAVENFGSGWTWLVKTRGGLEVRNTHDADTPLRSGATPLLVCDIWEHAYYIDYRNERAKYVDAFWNIINWDKVWERFGR